MIWAIFVSTGRAGFNLAKNGFFTKWVQNRPFDLKPNSSHIKFQPRPHQIDQKINQYHQNSKNDPPGGVPEHLGGTNLDEKDMPERFQALPRVKTSLKVTKMNDFIINKNKKIQDVQRIS